VYSPGSIKYTWHPTWHFETRVNPPRQTWNRSTNTRPLAAKLPNKQVIFNLLLFDIFHLLISWQVINYLQSHTLSTRYNYLLDFITKLYFISNIIYKLPAIIYKSIIICKGYNNLYKQGPATPLHSYKYQVQSNPQHTMHSLTP